LKTETLELIPLRGIGLVNDKTDLIDEIIMALENQDILVQDRDIFIVSHTIVSKWEGRIVDGSTVTVSNQAVEIAKRNGFDRIQVELALQESKKILRDSKVLITETHSGLVCNFSGVDKSNAQAGYYILLPQNPDASAENLRNLLADQLSKDIAVIIADTQGRPWRRGSINIGIGCAGINAFKHNKGKRDLYGRELQRSMVCQIDEIASAAENLMGQSNEKIPIVILRGYKYQDGSEVAKDIIRPKHEDMFR
jgi:coenzyme F420-0:L-glutamate ligase/coenzyme F420-1:gamma-L-glutamate ligase